MIRTQIIIEEGDKIEVEHNRLTGYHLYARTEKGDLISINIPSLDKLNEIRIAIEDFLQEKLGIRDERVKELEQEEEDLIGVSQSA